MTYLIKQKRPKTDYPKKGKSELISRVYKSDKWKKLRSAYLLYHPLCELCLSQDIVKSAQEVHHIKPISQGKDIEEMKVIAYDSTNLQALCTDCHHKIHNEKRKSDYHN